MSDALSIVVRSRLDEDDAARFATWWQGVDIDLLRRHAARSIRGITGIRGIIDVAIGFARTQALDAPFTRD